MARGVRFWLKVGIPVVALASGGIIAWYALAGPGNTPAAGPEVPNVILISLDTTRADHLPFYGYERDTAPRVRADLAEAGVVFDRGIAAHTNTAPSHATMLTSLAPATHGIERNGYELAEEATTLGEILQEAGYATGGFVSGWTLNRHTGLQRGFDVYDDTMTGPGRRPAEDTLEAALPWLREQAQDQKPFFLFFHLFDPHYPYDPPEGFAERWLPEDRDGFVTSLEGKAPGPKITWALSEYEVEEVVMRYDGEIAYADQQLGRLFDALKEAGAWEDTLVVFVSDHGETLYERSWVFDHGGRAYDEQIHVPFVVRLPGNAHAGRRVAPQVGHVDILPTVLDVLGRDALPQAQGKSLVPLIEGAAPDAEANRRPAFAHARPEPRRVPEIRAPLIQDGLVSSIRLPSVKLIEYPMSEGRWYRQLFDLEADPGETRNIAEEQPEVAEQLHRQLDRWRRATGGDEMAPPEELSPEIEEQLRALGYVE